MHRNDFLAEHLRLSRRYFLQAGLAASALGSLRADDKPTAETKSDAKPEATKESAPAKRAKPEKAGARGEPYFTPTEDFRDVSRGKPVPHSLPAEKLREVGLTRDTWR